MIKQQECVLSCHYNLDVKPYLFIKYCLVYRREARESILNYFQKRNIPDYVGTSQNHPQLRKVSW